MTRIAIVGGTGPEGRGLALRLAMAGHEVVIGSRDAGRAAEAASGLLEGTLTRASEMRTLSQRARVGNGRSPTKGRWPSVARRMRMR